MVFCKNKSLIPNNFFIISFPSKEPKRAKQNVNPEGIPAIVCNRFSYGSEVNA